MPKELSQYQREINERYPKMEPPHRVLGVAPKDRSQSGLFDTFGSQLQKNEVFTEHSTKDGTVIVTASLDK